MKTIRFLICVSSNVLILLGLALFSSTVFMPKLSVLLMVFIGPESSRSKISRAQKISRARTQGRNSKYFPVNVSGNEIWCFCPWKTMQPSRCVSQWCSLYIFLCYFYSRVTRYLIYYQTLELVASSCFLGYSSVKVTLIQRLSVAWHTKQGC